MRGAVAEDVKRTRFSFVSVVSEFLREQDTSVCGRLLFTARGSGDWKGESGRRLPEPGGQGLARELGEGAAAPRCARPPSHHPRCLPRSPDGRRRPFRTWPWPRVCSVSTSGPAREAGEAPEGPVGGSCWAEVPPSWGTCALPRTLLPLVAVAGATQASVLACLDASCS